MSATQSIADTALGLTAAEVQILRTQQQTIAQRAHQGAAADQPRGTSRHSQPSSRAASAASSQSLQGRVLLDPRSLQNLQVHLENVVRSVEGRIDEIQVAVARSVEASQRGAHRSEEAADAEMARMHRAIADIDRLEDDVQRIKNIRNKVKEIRIRVDKIGDRMAQAPANASGHGDRHADRHSSSRHVSTGHDRHRR